MRKDSDHPVTIWAGVAEDVGITGDHRRLPTICADANLHGGVDRCEAGDTDTAKAAARSIRGVADTTSRG